MLNSEQKGRVVRVADVVLDVIWTAHCVMEYVPGVPIIQFVDENRLSIGDRLRLFVLRVARPR